MHILSSKKAIAMEKQKDKKHFKQLVEEFGLLIERRLGISPLSARIYALLTLSSYSGLTFEEIREAIDASKSSTSVNVNVLIQLGYIEYYTKPGDRKRYFKVAKYFQLVSLETYQKSIENDMVMVERIDAYNKKNHPGKSTNLEPLGKVTRDYLQELHELVRDTVAKITAFQRNNQ